MNLTQLATSLAWICSLIMTVYTAYFLCVALFSLKKPRRYPEAEPGAHDDCVIALAIAHYVRPQQRMNVETNQPDAGGAKWTEDMWEDYRNADKAGKELLVQMWGQPN